MKKWTEQPIGDWVIYKNNQLIAFNKPPGLPVQPDLTDDKSMLELASIYTKGSVELIHRLDRPSSGLLIMAKNKKALAALNHQFKNRNVEKKYLAIVSNRPEKDVAVLEHYLIRNGKTNKSKVVDASVSGAKPARMSYRYIGSSDAYHLLEIELHSGRHHQIRAQLAAIGSPIKGDVKYGDRRKNKDRSIHLHAWKLQFTHPVSNELENLTAPVPSTDNLWTYFAENYLQAL